MPKLLGQQVVEPCWVPLSGLLPGIPLDPSRSFPEESLDLFGSPNKNGLLLLLLACSVCNCRRVQRAPPLYIAYLEKKTGSSRFGEEIFSGNLLKTCPIGTKQDDFGKAQRATTLAPSPPRILGQLHTCTGKFEIELLTTEEFPMD